MTDSTDSRVTIDARPSAEEIQAIRDGLLAFNVARLGPPNFVSIELVAREASGALLGGLLGHRRWGWLYVAQLWVDERHRARGVGSRLLRTAEDDARAAGCTTALLDTFSFQARPFYERQGYVVWATLEGYPPGHRQ